MRPRLRALRGRARTQWLVVGLVLAHVVLKVTAYLRMRELPLSGDEVAYVDGAKAIANALRALARLHEPDVAELRLNLVGSGQFLPGMSALLAPAYLVAPDAKGFELRPYLGVLSSVLFLAVVGLVWRWLGKRYAVALLVVPGLVPMWVFFTLTAWGDALAGLLVVLLLAFLLRLAVAARQGGSLTWRQGMALGALCASTLYLRSNTLPLVVGILALTALGVVVSQRGAARARGLLAAAAAVGLFSALLLPWSVFASKSLDGRVVTTTTTPLSLAVAFGDEDELCFGPCAPETSIWVSTGRYARAVAAVSGRSELDVQQAMADHALRGATLRSYASDVVDNAQRYLLHENDFESRFRPNQVERDDLWRLTMLSTSVLYRSAMAIWVVALLVVVRRSWRAQVTSLLLKLFSGALLVQPFVHIGSGRYWPTFVPLFAVAAALLVGMVTQRLRRAGNGPGLAGDEPGVRALVWAQAAAVAVALAVVVAVVTLGR